MSLNSYFGNYAGQTDWIDPSLENALPEVGQGRLLDLLGALSGRSLAFGASMAPMGEQALLNAYQALDPSQDLARARTATAALLGQAASAAQGQAAAMARRGFGQSAQVGAGINARNQALSRGQDSLLALLDPANRAKRYQGQYALTQAPFGSPVHGMRNQGFQIEGVRNQQDQASRGSFLGDILGIGAQVLPFIPMGGGRGGSGFGYPGQRDYFGGYGQ